MRTAENSLDDMLRRYYRTLFIPTRDGLKEGDLGVPTYGATKKLDEVAYENLRSNGEILEQIAPLLLRERYLRNNDAVSTQQLYQSSAKTPGSPRIISRSVWESGIAEGVKKGYSGLANFRMEIPVCRYFKEAPPLLAFIENEVIIREEICIAQKRRKRGKSNSSTSRLAGAAYPRVVKPSEHSQLRNRERTDDTKPSYFDQTPNHAKACA